jgi:hypothetical protein
LRIDRRFTPGKVRPKWIKLSVEINEALETRQVVSVTAWGIAGTERHVGVIDQFDGTIWRLRIVGRYETSWIPIDDILEIKL